MQDNTHLTSSISNERTGVLAYDLTIDDNNNNNAIGLWRF